MLKIPKKIHYCWFGGKPLPNDVKKYIDSWKKYSPDYEIIEWNENNIDLTQNQYCKEAYIAKKWAFVSDYIRLKVLYDNGGIYMDTDVEMCKPLDDFLRYDWFAGFESKEYISTGIMGSCRASNVIKILLDDYENRHFINDNGDFDLTTNVAVITNLLNKNYKIKFNNERQVFDNNNLLLPFDYLCAKDFFNGKVLKTKNTYTIHHFKGTWRSEKDLRNDRIRKILVRYFGEDFVKILYKVKKFLKG